jgi:hypothetical protein
LPIQSTLSLSILSSSIFTLDVNEYKNFECGEFKSIRNEEVHESKSTLKFGCVSIFHRKNLASCHILY